VYTTRVRLGGSNGDPDASPIRAVKHGGRRRGPVDDSEVGCATVASRRGAQLMPSDALWRRAKNDEALLSGEILALWLLVNGVTVSVIMLWPMVRLLLAPQDARLPGVSGATDTLVKTSLGVSRLPRISLVARRDSERIF
jgi:hypothetical protein